MADNVFHRRNQQIQDAIEGQNLKQALNLIDKRVKKGEDTVFLKVCCRRCYCCSSSVTFLVLLAPDAIATPVSCIDCLRRY